MLYILHGTDTIKARAKLKSLLDSLLAKKPDASLVRVDDETFDEKQLDDLIYGQGLFAQKYIVVFDKVFQNKEARDSVIQELKHIADSENIFIVIEENIPSIVLKKCEKYAEKIQVFEKKSALTDKKQFDIFSLTDALGRRDRKNLWLLYQKAKRENISDEEIHGILFWQTKSMLLTVGASSAKDAGLKPFVFQKAQVFCKNYTEQELRQLSMSLVSLYHEARRGTYELRTALELFVLNV